MSLALVLHPAEYSLERLISFGAQHLPQGGGKLFDLAVPAEVVEVGQECSTIPLAIHCLACREKWQPSSAPPAAARDAIGAREQHSQQESAHQLDPQRGRDSVHRRSDYRRGP